MIVVVAAAAVWWFADEVWRRFHLPTIVAECRRHLYYFRLRAGSRRWPRIPPTRTSSNLTKRDR